MNILAIETSCDETAAAVVRDGRHILSNVYSSQIKVHIPTGGIVPEVAARLQLEKISPVLQQALEQAGVGWKEMGAVAVTFGPGLVGSLLVGVETAKTLAYVHQIPLIAVNHLAGHLYACLKDETFDFPYLGLVVSGGHTELVKMIGHNHYRLVGSTRDDAAGESFDKVARLLELPYPGGPEISRLAHHGNPQAIGFPRAMLNQDNYEFSFSGLKSAVRREAESAPLSKSRRANIAASFQAAVVDILLAKTLKAASDINPTAVLLGGGVASNVLLRQQLDARLQEVGKRLIATPRELATDNAAMIGLAAYWMRDEVASPLTLTADPGAALASR